MSSEERDLILQMLSEGKISPSEAANLLDALDVKSAADAGGSGTPAQRRGHDSDLAGRSLLIHVSDGEETRTHVLIPLGMALAAGKFLPKNAREYFEKYGIDIKEILNDVASDLTDRGEIVNVRDGNTKVLISVT